MIQKFVHKRDLRNFLSIKEDLRYWLGKTPEERVAAVDYLRKAVSWRWRKTSEICSRYSTLTKWNICSSAAYALAFHGAPRYTGGRNVPRKPRLVGVGAQI